MKTPDERADLLTWMGKNVPNSGLSEITVPPPKLVTLTFSELEFFFARFSIKLAKKYYCTYYNVEI